jgi:3-oxoacyl-[acyl-carrier protein] reductase
VGELSLRSKIALITGSAKGLGKMTALSLADSGCDIVINYLSSRVEAEQLVKQIELKGVRSLAVQADITKPEELEQMVREIEQTLGSIDILINNAGPFIRERRVFSDYIQHEINHMIQGNLISAMQLDHFVLPGMRERSWGRIIHFGFGHAAEARGWPHRAVYAAAKVGLVSFTKTLAVEEAEYGITVNMICPGDIRGQNKEKLISEVNHLLDDESPNKRPGAGEDISRVITFLCQPESDFLTGNIVEVSGGLDPIRTLPIK